MSRHKSYLCCILVLCLCFLEAARGESRQVTTEDFMELCFHDTEMSLELAVSDHEGAMGLDEARIRNVIEAYLRSARIFSELKMVPSLKVSVITRARLSCVLGLPPMDARRRPAKGEAPKGSGDMGHVRTRDR